jgi:hypothetical protein
MAMDIQLFRQNPIYRSRAPLAGVLQDIDQLRGIDLEAEAQQARWTRWSRVLGGVSAVMFVLGFVLWFLLPVGALLAVVAALCVRQARKHQALNLANRRYELLAQVLTRLKPDIAPDEPLNLRVDFQPNDAPTKKLKSHKVGAWEAEDFLDPWLSLQVRLKDGTRLLLNAAERLRKRSRTRRNPRGKYKTKRKEKGLMVLQVRLRVKPERHPRLADLQSRAPRAVKLPPGAVLNRLRVSNDGVALRVRLPLDWQAGPLPKTDAPPARKPALAPGRAAAPKPMGPVDASRTVLMMLLSLYQVLNYSTALRKRAAARATSRATP